METGRRHSTIKVREGTYLRHGLYQADGGLIRVEVEIEEGKIEHLIISGDFAFFPTGMVPLLSESLKGVDFEFGRVTQKVSEFLGDHLIQCPGINAEDFACAVVGEKGGLL